MPPIHSGAQNPEESCMAHVQSGVRLPGIPLPRFSGDLASWPIFRDRCVPLIQDRPQLSNVEKYHYLCSAFDGEAVNAIKGFAVHAENYPLAWAALVKRYYKPRQIGHYFGGI